MFHLIAYQPEIPPNTGNMIRLCANSGATLHLVHPLGFELSASRVKRAGLDYHQMAHVIEHPDLESCLESLG
ncbi:MAG: tRNA (uridine(34)/cytosine(34)/5-carboxymethylaminomethyluridine(34)-2'-O)-methyltransferase TrmL, partial [Chromatiales bacterium]|nr:tRNA (uridine(34)/cytosine(34)/5-carboxymethylaminomethyluridine(34)-2'-O)-methyltransferase TrmL [Chromatiales bacterium]